MSKTIRSVLVCGVAVLLAVPSCSKRAPADTSASRPSPGESRPAAARPTAPRPGTQPTKPAKFPSDELVAECRKASDALRARLDRTFALTVSPPFVVAGNMTAKKLDRFTRYTVLEGAKAMWASYFEKKPDKVITVLLFADEKSYRAWAEKLYGDRDVSYYGYYKPDERALVMNIGTGGGTLVHELTHALIVYDFPDVPRWFNEGLGSLHEQCNFQEGKVIGLVNWRLKGLQDAIGAGKLRPLRELVTADDFYGAQRGLNYAQARYFCQYMQEKRLLEKFYVYLRANHKEKDSGAAAIEHIFGRKVEEVEKDFLTWVKPLKFPP